jgi:hypothetical protein
MRCPNCGKKIESLDQKFCRYCGADLKIKAQASQPKIDNTGKKTNIKIAKRCFILALLSFILALLTIIIGLLLIFIIINSIHFKQWDLFDWVRVMNSLGLPESKLILEEELIILGFFSGIIFILFDIAGLVLGIIALLLRKKVLNNGINNLFVKIGFIFAILGIFSSIGGLIIGVMLCIIPFYPDFFYHLKIKIQYRNSYYY